MLLYLLVREFEDLEAICVGRLGGLGLSEVVNDLLIRECLLDVAVVEVDDCVTIWEGLSAHSIAEDDFLLAVEVRPLYLAVIANNLILHFGVLHLFVVVCIWELHFIVFLLVLDVICTLFVCLSIHMWRLIIFVLLLVDRVIDL